MIVLKIVIGVWIVFVAIPIIIKALENFNHIE